MKSVIVIPAYNAASSAPWQAVLASVAAQTLHPERKILIDSSSGDDTCAIAESFGWECRRIGHGDFNHGLTRDDAVRELAAEGIDTVIFLSQDVILSEPDALSKLTAFLWAHPVAGCYGKQRTQRTRTFDAWQRKQCYPETSAVKSLDDVPRLGMMTPFFSNAFSAWKTAEVMQAGGFPATDFGEDMLLAARILMNHGQIGYCAEAVAMHDHSNSRHELFQRGREVGVFHRKHPELRQQFGGRFPTLFRAIPCPLWTSFAVKAAGYVCGRFFTR